MKPHWQVPPRRHPTLEDMEARIRRARVRMSAELAAIVLVSMLCGVL